MKNFNQESRSPPVLESEKPESRPEPNVRVIHNVGNSRPKAMVKEGWNYNENGEEVLIVGSQDNQFIQNLYYKFTPPESNYKVKIDYSQGSDEIKFYFNSKLEKSILAIIYEEARKEGVSLEVEGNELKECLNENEEDPYQFIDN
ncbi:hypothetical protein IC006_0462 [Sulfuracidifex tepidarius]|uniref:Uncharacterized protein n=1 Tax=Sulfuracidifex tepidarius TaxID=1294262 RepID=A0A510DSN8_9CREN|nr:hypothetical protein IC006_0462 [Sulfuracidifex tepidarius]